jgi:hypothetical protein
MVFSILANQAAGGSWEGMYAGDDVMAGGVQTHCHAYCDRWRAANWSPGSPPNVPAPMQGLM